MLLGNLLYIFMCIPSTASLMGCAAFRKWYPGPRNWECRQWRLPSHGNMYGVIHLYKEAQAQGIKPILGCEVYMTRGSRMDHPAKERLCHLILLAKNNEGYHNLIKIVSKRIY